MVLRILASDYCEERRAHPHNDLISALLLAEVHGERLSNEELMGFCVLLLVAGNETTTNLIGNAILCLDENPGNVERLRATRDLVPNANQFTIEHEPNRHLGFGRGIHFCVGAPLARLEAKIALN